MWFQDYSNRFFQCTSGDQALSPPWDQADDAFLTQTINIQTGGKNDQGADPRQMMMMMPVANNNQRRSPHGHDSNSNFGFGFDFDMKEAIPLGGLADNNNNDSSFSRRSPLDKVEYANSQMGLKWQACEFYDSIISLTFSYVLFIIYFF